MAQFNDDYFTISWTFRNLQKHTERRKSVISESIALDRNRSFVTDEALHCHIVVFNGFSYFAGIFLVLKKNV